VRTYHHIGIPTNVARPGETYLARFGLYVSGFPTSPYGIEWMRFEPGSPLHPLIKSLRNVALEVDDLDAALEHVRALGGETGEAQGGSAGRYANCRDDQGVEFSIFQAAAG